MAVLVRQQVQLLQDDLASLKPPLGQAVGLNPVEGVTHQGDEDVQQDDDVYDEKQHQQTAHTPSAGLEDSEKSKLGSPIELRNTYAITHDQKKKILKHALRQRHD
jgi:hypothetical protein